MASETIPTISHNALVLIGDGQKALFLRNKGTAHQVKLEVEQILEQDNPATREQGTDRPGRSVASVGTARSAVEEVDWHHIAKERSPARSQKHSIVMPTTIASTSSSSSRRQRFWAICARRFMPRLRTRSWARLRRN